jgi:hypothetical protein
MINWKTLLLGAAACAVAGAPFTLQLAQHSRPPSLHQAATSSNYQVWVNTRSGVYHYPGARWYGNTTQGKFMSEAEARAEGYRPARNGQ